MTAGSGQTERVRRPRAAADGRADSRRRTQILHAAAELFASSGYARALLKDVADACGILPGSLYHHFDSKESIAVELLERYRDALDAVAAAAPRGADITAADTAFEPISRFATAIAGCALDHRAALQLSIYEPHAGAGAELVRLARQRPVAIENALRELLDAARSVGYLGAEIDRSILTEQMCETMLHTGLSVLHRESAADQVATVLCRLLFEGTAAKPPTDRDLDRSPAMRTARRIVDTWAEPAAYAEDDRLTMIRSVARAEFARRGYEATTMRDIAAAAELGAGSVYRTVESKKALLDSIMGSFHAELSGAYQAVVGTDSTSVAKLDALTWINLSAIERFDEEFAIQRAWFRSSPPDTRGLLYALRQRARQIRTVIEVGRRAGEIRLDGVAISRLSACVRDLIWMPPGLAAKVGTHTALAHSRATLLRGAARAHH